MKNKEIEELLKGMRDVSNTEGCSMNLDRYLVKLLLSYIEQLVEFKKEHLIMRQILIENGLWEKLLNDDRFLNYLREGGSDDK